MNLLVNYVVRMYRFIPSLWGAWWEFSRVNEYRFTQGVSAGFKLNQRKN